MSVEPASNGLHTRPRNTEEDHRTRPLVFFLPGLFGEGDPEIAKFLEPLHPYLTLVQVGYFDWAGHVQTDFDYGAVERHVIAQIESRAPDGPIRMAGYSLGGHLAFAAALALEAKGRQVECLGILDAPADFGSVKGDFKKRLRNRARDLLTFNLRGGLASVISKILIREQSRPALRALVKYKDRPLPLNFHEYLYRKITMQLVRRIYAAWWEKTLREAAPLQATWYLFRSEEHEATESQDLGWASFCPNLEIIHVPGTHRGMLDPTINATLQAEFIKALGSHHVATTPKQSEA